MPATQHLLSLQLQLLQHGLTPNRSIGYNGSEELYLILGKKNLCGTLTPRLYI